MSCLYANANKDIFKNSAWEPSLVSDNRAAVATGYLAVKHSQTKLEMASLQPLKSFWN